MQVANLIIFDIETGGFDFTKQGLCELAAIVIDIDSLEEIDRYEAIIAPYQVPNPDPASPDKFIMTTYSQEALDINRLTRSQIDGGKQAKQVAQEFAKLCKTHAKGIKGGGGKLVPAGHNIQKFDIPWMEFFFDLQKIKLSDLFNHAIIDTLLWTRCTWSLDGSIVNHKHDSACAKAGVQLVDGHRAMKDVEANTELVRYFIRNMRNERQDVQLEVKKRFREEFKFD